MSGENLAAERGARALRPAVAWGRQVGLIFQKELLLEAASGEVVLTSAFFAVLVVVLASFAFFVGPATALQVAAGALWLSVAFAAVLAIGRSWQREREENALAGLLVADLSRSALFAGKALALWLFLTAVEALVLPLCGLFFAVDLLPALAPVVLTVLVATPGVAAAGTLFGAMTVRTRARDLLLATVLFPLMAPQLLTAVVATRELLLGEPLRAVSLHFLLLGTFDALFVAGGLALFGPLIDD